MNWLKAFRIALFTDSVVYVLKLCLPIYLLVDTVKWKQRFDKSEKHDSSYVTELTIAQHLVEASILIIFILLRLMTNYCQYQNALQAVHKRSCVKIGCCSCCWFTVSIYNSAFFVLSLWTGWIHGFAVLCLLCWDIVILCFMVAFKLSVSTPVLSNVVQFERHRSKEEVLVQALMSQKVAQWDKNLLL